MDPELLRQRQLFVQRATTALTNAPRKATTDVDANKKKKKPGEQGTAPVPYTKAIAVTPMSGRKVAPVSSALMSPGAPVVGGQVSGGRVRSARVVGGSDKRHLIQQYWPLSLSDILEEIQVYDLSKRAEAWLIESLPNNPRLSVDAEGKFSFKPPYKVKGKTSLLALLKRYDTDGKGGVLHSELAECTATVDALIRSLGDQVIEIPTQVNKRKDRVYFYSDPQTSFRPDDEFRSLWRGVSVDHLDEKKIEEYLSKHGIDSMKDLAPKRTNFGPPKRKVVKRKTNQKVHNEHLSDILEDYVGD